MASGGMIPVRVAIRIRPLSGKERQEGCENALRVVEGRQQIALLNCDKAFTYDFAFDMFAPQQTVFDKAVDPLIDNLFKGYNVTVLAYGQTGSGKTYTMGTSRSTITPTSDTQEGVIARAVDKIFGRIDELKVHYEFKVRVAFVELYMENLCDLLCTKGDNVVDLREHPEQGVYIANLTELPIASPADMFEALVRGSSKRATAATNMNSVSSRSHAIFTIFIEGTRRDASISEATDKSLEGMPDSIKVKFHLVDLAGSERAKKTGATGERYKEGVSINMGLLSLGNVIAALGEDNGPKGHISYRDSKLTRLLQDSLGGNSHTLMIACVSPADSNIEESLNTLRYADRARKIKNKPIVNRGSDKEEVARLRRENTELKMQLAAGTGGALSGIEAKELLDLRERYDFVVKENKDLTGALSVIRSNLASDLSINGENGGSGGDPDGGEDDLDEEAMEKKQANLASQLANLNDVLAQKEQLASTMQHNEEKIQEMREKYEKSLASLQEELATLQQEREKLESQNKPSKGNEPNSKISEQRRKRIQELENQMSELRKKVTEQSRAMKLHERTEKQAKKLAEEISQMKSNKVKLIKQMKEDAEKNRVWKQAKEKEVQKLKQNERKQQVQIVKMETMHVKQQNVMKRKMEEASLANKRLQEVIDKQKNAKKMRAGMATSGKPGLLGAAERVRSMVNHELDIATTIKDAIQSREVLMKDRAELSKQLTKLRGEARLTMMASDRVKIDKKRKELQTELDAANTQISSLQKQIMEAKQSQDTDTDAGGKVKSWIDSFQSMSEAKLALQHLFERSTDLISTNSQLKSEKTEAKQLFSDASASVRSLEDEIRRLNAEHQSEVLQLKTDYEEQKSLLLSKFTNPHLEVKEGDLAKYSEFQAKLKKSMKKTKAKKETIQEEDEDVEFEEEEEEDSGEDEYDYEEDPDWRQTPLFRRLKTVKHNLTRSNSTLSTRRTMVLPGNNDSAEEDGDASVDAEAAAAAAAKRKSNSSGCSCKKSGCNSNRCACKKANRACTEACKCVSCSNTTTPSDGGAGGEGAAGGVEDCTAGTVSLLSATFDISDVKENLQPPGDDSTFTAEPKQLFKSPANSPNNLAIPKSPMKPLATPLSKYCDVTPAASSKRKTIFQSPLSESNDSPQLPRPLFRTPMNAN